MAGDVAAVDGFFARFDVDPVAGFHLGNGAAGIVVEFAGVSVSDVGEGGGTDQDQDGGKCEYAFHRRGSFRLCVENQVFLFMFIKIGKVFECFIKLDFCPGADVWVGAFH